MGGNGFNKPFSLKGSLSDNGRYMHCCMCKKECRQIDGVEDKSGRFRCGPCQRSRSHAYASVIGRDVFNKRVAAKRAAKANGR